MKKIKRSIVIVLTGIVLLCTIPVVLLYMPYFQQKITHGLTELLEKKIGTNVSIGYTELTPFKHLVLTDVYAEDQNGDTLLYANKLSAGFDFWPLLQGKFRFNSVHLSDFDARLSKDDDGTLTIQYIIDAFHTEKKIAKDLRIDLIINDITLERGRFSYAVIAGATRNPLKKDIIQLNDLAANINLQKVQNKTVKAKVKSLSFNEQSGFQLKKLTCDFLYDDGDFKINQLNIKLPHSTFYLRDIAAQYDSKASEPLQFECQLASSPVQLRDINRFVPVFAHFNDQLELAGRVSGTLKNLELSDWSVREGNDVSIQTRLNIKDLGNPDPGKIYVDGTIQQARFTTEGLHRTFNNFNAQPQALPTVIQRLGTIALNGKANGYLKNLTASLNLTTEVGNLQADVDFGMSRGIRNAHAGSSHTFLEGKITSSQLDMKRLMNNADFGMTQFEMQGVCRFENAKEFTGNIDATVKQFEYKTYNYQNVNLLGNFTHDSFKGAAKVDNPDGQLDIDGSFLFKGVNSEYNFTAKATDLQLHKLHLVRNDYTLRRLSVDAVQENNRSTLSFHSDLVDGEIMGHYTVQTLIDALKQTISAYLPSLVPPSSSPKGRMHAPTSNAVANRYSRGPAPAQVGDGDLNVRRATARVAPTNAVDFKLDLVIHNSERLSSNLKLPVTIYKQARIDGFYSSEQDKILLNAHFPRLKLAGSVIENGTVHLDNDENYISLLINGKTVEQKKGNLNFEVGLRATNDLIYSDIHWRNHDTSKYRGGLDFTTQLAYGAKNKQLSLESTFLPSEIVINDSVWTLTPSTFAYHNGRLSIHNFKAKHNRQLIEIEGNASKNSNDEISIALNKVDLDYIFKSLDIKALTFGGIATGHVSAKDIYNTRELSTYLDVSDFAFNSTVFGDLALRGRWDNEQQGVEMKGNIIKNDTMFVGVDGFIYPVSEELSIDFDAHHTNAAFLRKYLNTIAPNFSGEVTGKIRLFGSLNDPTVEGDAWIQNGSFDIDFLNTTYSFSDWVHCKPDEISLQNVTLHDKYGHSAQLTGLVHHNLFEDFQFSANISCDNFLVFDATPQKSPVFYGPIFGTGTTTIQGTEHLVHIDAIVNPTGNTHLTFNFLQAAEVNEYDFVNFVTKQTDTIADPKQSKPLINKSIGTDLRFNLLTNLTNAATFDVIMDAAGKDKISGSGTGNLQLQYGTQTPLKIFGNYQIERGNYNFSFQQAFFRNFKIEEGSSVTFRGDPLTADLNIKAAYTVSANLGDLDQGLLTTSSSDIKLSVRDNIPVSCVLLLNGQLEHPTVKFDLQLPGATAELERQVKSYIRTEDMLNRQIVYLLALGRFYTSPEYTRNDSRLNNDYTMLTAGLSNQISNLLGHLSEHLHVDTKFHQYYEDGDANTEVEVLLSGTLLNNRLILNGNFGYANSAYTNSTQNMPLVGDFDVEYKLTKSGDIRLKGFNHYNYRNYFSLTPEWTQGFGILFRRDFNTPKDIFKKKKDQ
ncbi:MAG: translocation/assembly module TamB domain-containing protein [Candidatus Symbiothrix sp.]|jgi:hypothetical protein|nr:translocation/assembly module TamB domain-containing protein [Candidatus Symbiothrix sp.]